MNVATTKLFLNNGIVFKINCFRLSSIVLICLENLLCLLLSLKLIVFLKKKEELSLIDLTPQRRRLPTLPKHSVPSARLSLTSLFGMGRGGTSAL